MKGIIFGDLHTFADMRLILESQDIGAPNVKVNKIDLPGADSALDLTDFFGEPKYDSTKLKFQFSSIEPQDAFLTQFSQIKNAIHGKAVRIILDDDPTFFYMGRCFVSSFTSDRGVGTVSVECECEPYKYKLAKTVVSKAVNGTASITLTNSRKRAVPEVLIDTTGSLNIVFQTSNVWDLGKGSFTLPELELVEGDNVVTVTGVGNITFTWQEAML